MQRPLRIGTRGSPLALAQANMVAAALRAAHGWTENEIEIVPIVTTGDKIHDRPLAEIGGKALWTRELDQHLLEGHIDVSIHSMKDVETLRPAQLVITALLPRGDVHDRLIGASSIAGLLPGARVGTSSPRRAAQLRHLRPDLGIVGSRGNVQTRLAKLECGEADAIVLAAAGLDRLGLRTTGTAVDLLPAPAQGAIGIEARAAAKEIRALLQAIDHSPTHMCVLSERRLLEELGGDCRSPVAALAVWDEGQIRLRAEILTEDGSMKEAGECLFRPDDHEAPRALARSLLERAEPALRTLFAG